MILVKPNAKTAKANFCSGIYLGRPVPQTDEQYEDLLYEHICSLVTGGHLDIDAAASDAFQKLLKRAYTMGRNHM